MKNKVVVITGSSSGIGEACARLFAEQGSKVVLAARNEKRLTQITQDILNNGNEAIFFVTDISKEKDCKLLIEKSVSHYGKIDILINNAGISMRAILNELDTSVIQKVMDVNFFGTVFCTKYALPHILKEKGSVVGVSSIAGYKGLPGRCAYSASKFAMQGFLESIRIENLKNKLHVLIACPGFTSSNIRNTALNKYGQVQSESPRDEQQMMSPEQVAKQIYLSIKKRQNTLVLTINGKLTVFLNKLFPNLVDKLVFNHLKKEPNSPF
jgi:short-subunit dehydrogenase